MGSMYACLWVEGLRGQKHDGKTIVDAGTYTRLEVRHGE